MKKKFYLKQSVLLILSLILAITSTIVYYSKVEAAEQPNVTCEVGDLQFNRPNNEEIIKINQWIEEGNKIESEELILKQYSKSLKFNFKKRHIMKVENNDEIAYFVYYPIIGAAEKDSNYIIIFNQDGKLVEDYLLLGLKNPKGNINSIVRKNDKVIIDAIINNEGDIISGYKITDNGKKQYLTSEVKPMFWSCFNACLANQGIASWAIATLGIICAVACVGTVGLACYGCLLAADIVAGSTVGYCVGICS